MSQEPRWPPFEKIQAQLRSWEQTHPETMRLDVLGPSVQGRPIYATCLSDPRADDEHKEHVLITSQKEIDF